MTDTSLTDPSTAMSPYKNGERTKALAIGIALWGVATSLFVLASARTSMLMGGIEVQSGWDVAWVPLGASLVLTLSGIAALMAIRAGNQPRARIWFAVAAVTGLFYLLGTVLGLLGVLRINRTRR